MTNLNDWSVADLLALYKRIEAHVSENPEPVFFLDYSEANGWDSEQNLEGDVIQFTEAEAKLLLFFLGREHDNRTMMIHLYSIAGHFRSLIKAKVNEAIPEPPKQWYNYLAAYRTNWTPEDKVKKEAKPGTIRLGKKIIEARVPFPKGNMNKHEDPPF